LSRVRDLFFDEFYEELQRVVEGMEPGEETPEPSILTEEIRSHWIPYTADPEARDEALVSVDGGVQLSRFA